MTNNSWSAAEPQEDLVDAPCVPRRILSGPASIVAFQVGVAHSMFDLWCLRASDVNPSILASPHQLGLLSPRELQRHAQFHYQKDRNAFLTKRLLVRGVLSQYASVRPEDWEFAENAYGRPALAASCDGQGLHFNLSKSNEMAVCAISRCGSIGVDVEDTAGADTSELSSWVLGSDERDRLGALPPSERSAALLRYWTLKEAYVKARGVGLTLPVADIHFDYKRRDDITLSFAAGLTEDPLLWRFAQLRLLGRYIVAVAFHAGDDCG